MTDTITDHNTSKNTTDNLLTLFCLVDGESAPFSVDINSSKTVDHLKVAIKDKLSPRFDDISVVDLTLWCVSIPVADDDDDDADVPIYINNISKDDKKKLKPTRELSDVFGYKAAKNMIHVIVQRPPP
ncbi:hypothetical protein EDD11_006555, partial [Mortierella claussenii]